MLEIIYAIIVVITCLTENTEYVEVSDRISVTVDKADKDEP